MARNTNGLLDGHGKTLPSGLFPGRDNLGFFRLVNRATDAGGREYGDFATAPFGLGNVLVTKSFAAQAITAGTPVNIWTPTAGKKFRLLGFEFSSSAVAAILLKDGGNTNATFWSTALLAIAGIARNPDNFLNGYLGAAADGILKIDVSANATLTGSVFGVEE